MDKETYTDEELDAHTLCNRRYRNLKVEVESADEFRKFCKRHKGLHIYEQAAIALDKHLDSLKIWEKNMEGGIHE